MLVVKTYADLQELKAAAEFPESFHCYVEREWFDLYVAYSDKEEISKFSLESHGWQACLEPGDQAPEGLWRAEYVECIRLEDAEIYRMYVMETEEFGVLYYSIVGTLNDESESFLREHAEMSKR